MHTDPAVTHPSAAGYHCDGECWSECGKSAALIEELGRANAKARDWFAQGDWAVEANLRDWALPPMGEVHPTQDFLVESTVFEYVIAGYTTEKRGQEFFERYPTLFKWHGKWFIFQGTHRLAAHFKSNPTTFYGWKLDLDAILA